MYIPPEIFRYFQGDNTVELNWEKTDVYSLGVVLLQVFILRDLKSEKIDTEYIESLLQPLDF